MFQSGNNVAGSNDDTLLRLDEVLPAVMIYAESLVSSLYSYLKAEEKREKFS